MSNCTKIESFGATDISATLGSGINMGRAVSCCTRLLLEFRSRKRFPNHALFGQVRRETWRAFSKKPLCFQQAQRILSPLHLPFPPRRRFDFPRASNVFQNRFNGRQTSSSMWPNPGLPSEN